MNRPFARSSLFQEHPAFISADALGARPAGHTLAKEVSPSFVLNSTAQPLNRFRVPPRPRSCGVLTLLFPMS